MKALIVLGAVVAVFTAAPAGAAVPSQDQLFAVTAAQGGKAEVMAGRLALSKSHNVMVRAFAQRMIADHSKANAQLASIAQANGVTLPGAIDQMDQSMADKLSGLSGAAFDKAYLSGQQIAHKRTIALFVKEAGQGRNPQFVAFAKQTLPTLKMHYAMVNTDVAKMGGPSSAM